MEHLEPKILFLWIIEENINIMKNNEAFKRYYQNLSCKIFVAGQSTEGECVVFVMYGDSKAIYSCVVDSFVSADRIVPKDILHMLGIDHIDDLFWTHPHDDHSNGIIELVEELQPNNVYMPSELHELSGNATSISADVLSTLNKYKSHDKRYKDQPKINGISTNSTLYQEMLHVSSYCIPFEVFAIAPCSGKVRRNSIENKLSSLNDYSIVISIIIGDFSILLTGDVQNRMIGYAYDDLYREVPTPNILKVPHHGSNDSTEILNLFSNDIPIDIAVTTAKKSSNLPREEAIRSYNTFCDNFFRIKPDSSNCALWGAEINILEATITQIANKNY